MNEVTLWQIDGPILIASHKTGVFYKNQVDGVLTKQAYIEGFIIPLPINKLISETIFSDEFWLGLDWNKKNTKATVDKNTKELEKRINKLGIYRLKDFKITDNSIEAWFECRFIYNEKVYDGVITWENSD